MKKLIIQIPCLNEAESRPGTRRMAIAPVPIQSNPKTRPSRLFESTFSYIENSAATSVRVYTKYEPLRVFTYIGLVVFAAGTALSARFFYYYRRGDGPGQEARADASAEHR